MNKKPECVRANSASGAIEFDVRSGVAEQTVRSGQQFLKPLMNRRQKMVFMLFGTCWLLSLVFFWSWWFDPAHVDDQVRFVLNTIGLVCTLVVPGYFVWFVSRMQAPSEAIPIRPGQRLAMVVTKAPSEPFPVVERTLLAMLSQEYPHDTWLADEDPAPETIDWCRRHGVCISTRKGIKEYHRDRWPRRTRCKEGNLAYFYDSYGYDNYEIVMQMDADHVPAEGYLEEMLRPFADPRVGYVSAPSICDNNAADSWSARSRLFAESHLHGPLQAGYNAGFAPLCFGSHYAVRTKALRDIGGLGPELAEDHSTTLMMNAYGWRGVHAINAEAHGDGPERFEDLVRQEFQWSRSLFTILLRYSPTYVRPLPTRLKFQFLFSQCWYTLFGSLMFFLYMIPIIALLTKRVWVNVVFVNYAVHAVPSVIVLLLLVLWLKKNGWIRPKNAKIYSWEASLFVFSRWPWVFAGTLAAVYDFVRGKEGDFKVTPKGGKLQGRQGVPLRVIMPYVFLSLLSGFAVIAMPNVGNARGFYAFALLNCIIYALLTAVIVVKEDHS